MKAYIAGPMRGYERFNFPAFDTAKDWLIEKGWDVISPADLDRAEGITGFTRSLPEDFILQALRRDFAAICECDAIVLLPGWHESEGARAEVEVALKIGLDVFHINLNNGELTEEDAT